MAIKQITEREFSTYNPPTSPLHREESWFASDSGHLLGAVVQDTTDDDWAFVILGRDENGQFRAIDLKTNFNQKVEAERSLLSSMQAIDADGQLVFPQG